MSGLVVLCVFMVIGFFMLAFTNHKHGKQKDSLRQELAFEKTMLEAIFDCVPEVMCVKDLDGVIIRVNKQFEQFFSEHRKNEIIGHDSSALSLPEELVKLLSEADKTVINEKRIVTLEKSIADSNGEIHYFEIVETPLAKNECVYGIIAIAHDITHRKEKEEAAQSASRAKSDFLAKMSHEMRTPLTAVIGLTELIIETKTLDEEILTTLVKIYRSGETLLRLVNDVLDMSKIEADKLVLNEHEYELPSLINDTITQSSIYAAEKPIDLFLNINSDLPDYLYGDDLRIRQLINNLLSNAFKYTKKGTVELGLSCEKADNEVIWLTIWVRDTGIGIRKEDMDKLFTMYTKMDENSRENIGRTSSGTGLGLYITKHIAELMNGTVTVESEYGKGSTFTIRLMQRYVNDAVIGDEVVENLRNFNYSLRKIETAKLSRINMSYARVLVVDDNPTNLDVARGLLSLYGIKVDCINNGKQAVEIIRNGTVKYNAVFMDHMMPDMDGVTATQIIHNDIGTDYARNIPIIALTANAIVGNEELFLKSGFQAFLSKPIDLARLDVIVRQWVRDKKAEATLAERTIEIVETGENQDVKLRAGIPGIDARKGINHFGNDVESYMRVLSSYAKNTKPLLDAVKEVCFDDIDQYTVIIHGIKGSSYGIFAEQVGREASALEKAAKIGDYEYIDANHSRFLYNTYRLIEDIEDVLEKELNKKPKKTEPDTEMLRKLYNACLSYDIDGMDDAMEKIERWEYTEDNGLVVQLRKNLEQGKYRAIKDMLTVIPDILQNSDSEGDTV